MNDSSNQDHNPYAAPVCLDQPGTPGPRHPRISNSRLVGIAYGFRCLNILVSAIVGLVLFVFLSIWTALGIGWTLLICQIALSLSVIMLVALLVVMLFFVYPAPIAILGLLSFAMPLAWPVTLLAVNSKARQILVDQGMSVGVFGSSTYLAESIDGRNSESSTSDLWFDRIATFSIFVLLFAVLLNMF